MSRDLVQALTEGTAFVDLSFWRKVEVSGADALGWLNDLVTADLSQLRPGGAVQALLLSPTGQVRAQFTVAMAGGDVVLIQDPVQPRPIMDLLQPYTLSSDVALQDRTGALALFAFPGREEAPTLEGATATAPSCAGRGSDLLCPGGNHDAFLSRLCERLALAGAEDLEVWRICAGLARVGVDVRPQDLPQEAGLQDAVSFDKGCYLGQEAVARVRNLGHPRRLIVHLQAHDRVSAGDALRVGEREAGRVTSASVVGDRSVVLASVRWELREGPFSTDLGVALEPARF